MRDKLFRKVLVLTIIVLFVGANVTPSISGTISKISDLEDDKRILNKGISSNRQISSSSLTFYTFDKTGKKQCNVVLPTDAANDIYDMQEELKYKIVYEPRSDETKALKNKFVDMLDAYGLIPRVLSKKYVLSLLNPSWLNNRQKTPNIRPRVPFLSNLVSRIIRNIIDLRQIFKNRFEKTIDLNAPTHLLFADSATAMFCSISSGGQGVTLPLFLLPRPRAAAAWSSSSALTLVGELLSGKGFLAEGAQEGILLGFIGLGLTYAFPGFHTYGFIGYALYTKVKAEYIDRVEPPNQEPVISDENPPSGTQDVPLSLSELSFRISDADGDLMDYTVTTEPNIGTGNGYNKKDGVYTVPISGLEYDKSYSWTVEVTDDKDTTMKQFSFSTGQGPPFDPFDEGWQYRKKVTIDHNKVDGDLSDFPILVSIVDNDIKDKAQNDGDDILFMDGSGFANKLYHEIEYFDGSSGELVAWVNVPSLSSSVDSVFYMYYGNPSCSSQEFPEKVWDSNYMAVWHLSELSETVYDSTFNDNDGTIYGGAQRVNGISGYAFDFDGANDYVEVPDSSSLDVTQEITLSAWVKFDIISTDPPVIIFKRGDGDDADEKYKLGVADYQSNAEFRINSNPVEGGDLNTGEWYHIAGTFNGNIKRLYLNGVEVAEETQVTTIETSNRNLYIGADRDYGGFNQHVDGIIDEVHISNTNRNAERISTQYNNQNDPLGFLSFGPEESGP